MEVEYIHKPVMLDECINLLNIKPNGIYVDATLGGGGHSKEILKRLNDGMLIGIDQDDFALSKAKDNLKDYNNVIFVKNNFSNIDNILNELSINEVDGILMDLGVSSFQLDDPERGFSYRYDAPLDMRMSKDNPISAMDVVNNYDEDELYRIIRDYGEERYAKRIANTICRKRREKPIRTTFELVDIIKSSLPSASKRETGHPAKRTFQAIRIEVNGELTILEKSIFDGIERLKRGGRIAIITFHSLEDRIVKNSFVTMSRGCTCPNDFPVCVCGNKPKVKIITKKPITSSENELLKNPRSSSAKLRIAEKI